MLYFLIEEIMFIVDKQQNLEGTNEKFITRRIDWRAEFGYYN